MNQGRTWFVTGTDTDAGKTSVARALLHGARATGLRARGYKPVESGAEAESSGPDAQALAAAASAEIQTTYVYEAPVAPLLAAKLVNRTIRDIAKVIMYKKGNLKVDGLDLDALKKVGVSAGSGTSSGPAALPERPNLQHHSWKKRVVTPVLSPRS